MPPFLQDFLVSIFGTYFDFGEFAAGICVGGIAGSVLLLIVLQLREQSKPTWIENEVDLDHPVNQGTMEDGSVMVSASKTSGYAIASVIFGVAGWILLPVLGWILAIITGHIAKVQIRKRPRELRGIGLANAGLGLGYLPLVGIMIILILVALGDVIGVWGSY